MIVYGIANQTRVNYKHAVYPKPSITDTYSNPIGNCKMYKIKTSDIQTYNYCPY